MTFGICECSVAALLKAHHNLLMSFCSPAIVRMLVPFAVLLQHSSCLIAALLLYCCRPSGTPLHSSCCYYQRLVTTLVWPWFLLLHLQINCLFVPVPHDLSPSSFLPMLSAVTASSPFTRFLLKQLFLYLSCHSSQCPKSYCFIVSFMIPTEIRIFAYLLLFTNLIVNW